MSSAPSVEYPATCIILAGGFGTRLKSVIPDKPKCLAPIGDKSFLEIQLTLLKKQGITNFALSLGHMSHLVLAEIEKLRNEFNIRYVIEDTPLGTGGAVLFAMNELGIEEAMVTNGDTFLGGDLSAMLKPLNILDNEQCRMAVIEVANMSRYGGVELTGNNLTGFREKGQSGTGLINAGFYRISKQAFLAKKDSNAFSFETELMPTLSKQKMVTASVIAGDFVDIGIPEDYTKFCDYFQELSQKNN
jgi:D-glycero-alpha-D-manno-heptose 1-phosphate guanylyltransferase